MTPHELVTGVLAGCVLIVFGLVPGLFQGLVEGVQNFRDSLSSIFPIAPQYRSGYENLQPPRWMAGVGAALTVLTVLGYLLL
jgi:hypothetical protein